MTLKTAVRRLLLALLASLSSLAMAQSLELGVGLNASASADIHGKASGSRAGTVDPGMDSTARGGVAYGIAKNLEPVASAAGDLGNKSRSSGGNGTGRDTSAADASAESNAQ